MANMTELVFQLTMIGKVAGMLNPHKMKICCKMDFALDKNYPRRRHFSYWLAETLASISTI